MTRLAPDQLAVLGDALHRRFGFNPSAAVRQSLPQAAASAARALRNDLVELVARVERGDEAALAALADFGLNHESSFFRHAEQWDALRQLFAADASPALRLWCAGCSTGEEAYTAAMCLLEAGRAGRADLVLGTDVSAASLAHARAGVYGEHALRGVSGTRRATFFEPGDGGEAVVQGVRRRVVFEPFNLLGPAAPLAGCDAVICRNVLIYFDEPTVRRVLDTLVSALRPGGLLVLGPVEVPLAAKHDVERVERDGVVLYRRRDGLVRTAPPPPPRAPRPPTQRASTPLPRTAPLPTPAPDGRTLLARAREAAHRDDPALARELALRAAEALVPEAYLLLAVLEDAKGDGASALAEVRRALYLAPRLAPAHAMKAALCERLGHRREAALARQVTLDLLAGLGDEVLLEGVEPVTAGALRRAVEAGDGS